LSFNYSQTGLPLLARLALWSQGGRGNVARHPNMLYDNRDLHKEGNCWRTVPNGLAETCRTLPLYRCSPSLSASSRNARVPRTRSSRPAVSLLLPPDSLLLYVRAGPGSQDEDEHALSAGPQTRRAPHPPAPGSSRPFPWCPGHGLMTL
jgi:hypothetical protein